MTVFEKRFREDCALLLVRAGKTIDAPMREALERYVVTVAEAKRVRRLVRRGVAETRELVRVEDAAQRYGQALGLEPLAPAKTPGRPKGTVAMTGETKSVSGLGQSPAAKLRSVK